MSDEVEELDAAIAEHEQKIEKLKARRLELGRPESFKTTWYTHSNMGHYEMIEQMGLDEELYGDVDYSFKYALYEVEFDVDVNLRTGEYKVLEVRTDGQVLRPVEGGEDET